MQPATLIALLTVFRQSVQQRLSIEPMYTSLGKLFPHDGSHIGVYGIYLHYLQGRKNLIKYCQSFGAILTKGKFVKRLGLFATELVKGHTCGGIVGQKTYLIVIRREKRMLAQSFLQHLGHRLSILYRKVTLTLWGIKRKSIRRYADG